MIDHNPLDDSDCFLRAPAPSRSFLEVVQIEALLDAARSLDGEQPGLTGRQVAAIRADERPATHVGRDFGVSETLIRRIRRGEIWNEEGRRHVARLPLVATLVLAGPRVSELCRLDSPGDIDLAGRRVRIPRVKTDAGERACRWCRHSTRFFSPTEPSAGRLLTSRPSQHVPGRGSAPTTCGHDC